MQYGLRGPGSSLRKFKAYGRILAPLLPVGSISGAPVAWVLENKFVILVKSLLPKFICSFYIVRRGGRGRGSVDG
jgi:hypothetical protein